MTILTMYHGALLVTMGDYLQNDIMLFVVKQQIEVNI